MWKGLWGPIGVGLRVLYKVLSARQCLNCLDFFLTKLNSINRVRRQSNLQTVFRAVATQAAGAQAGWAVCGVRKSVGHRHNMKYAIWM